MPKQRGRDRPKRRVCKRLGKNGFREKRKSTGGAGKKKRTVADQGKHQPHNDLRVQERPELTPRRKEKKNRAVLKKTDEPAPQ